MKFLIVVIFCLVYLLDSCYCAKDPTDEGEPAAVNCTKIGVALTCCQTEECVLVNCTDGDECRPKDTPTDWGEGCKTAVPLEQQCQNLEANASSPTASIDDTTVGTSNTPEDTSTTVGANTPATMVQTNQTEPITTPDPPTDTTNSSISGTTIDHDITTDGNNETTTLISMTTSPPSINQTTSNVPETSPLSSEPQCSRQFDAASFVGGMVFVAGLTAIAGFMYKYFKSRQEYNYGSL